MTWNSFGTVLHALCGVNQQVPAALLPELVSFAEELVIRDLPKKPGEKEAVSRLLSELKRTQQVCNVGRRCRNQDWNIELARASLAFVASGFDEDLHLYHQVRNFIRKFKQAHNYSCFLGGLVHTSTEGNEHP